MRTKHILKLESVGGNTYWAMPNSDQLLACVDETKELMGIKRNVRSCVLEISTTPPKKRGWKKIEVSQDFSCPTIKISGKTHHVNYIMSGMRELAQRFNGVAWIRMT